MEPRMHFEPNEDRTQPVLIGTKVTLNMVLDALADGSTIDEVVQSSPELTKDQVVACLHFGSELVVEAYTEKMKAAKLLKNIIRKLKVKPITFTDAAGNKVDIRTMLDDQS